KGYAVPQLIGYDDNLWIIEMTVVTPPYIIDFGKAYLQKTPPDFSPETMADWIQEKEELYGDHWPEIRSILNRLKSLGIHHMAPKPATILPATWNPSLDKTPLLVPPRRPLPHNKGIPPARPDPGPASTLSFPFAEFSWPSVLPLSRPSS